MHFPAVNRRPRPMSSEHTHSRTSEKGEVGVIPAGDGEGDGRAKTTGSEPVQHQPYLHTERVLPRPSGLRNLRSHTSEKSLPACIPMLKKYIFSPRNTSSSIFQK